MTNLSHHTVARNLRTAGLLAILVGMTACAEEAVRSEDNEQDLMAICKAAACIQEEPAPALAGNIIKTGDNYWIGMTDNAGNQTLSGWLEDYCKALGMKAGCFGTHGSPGGGLQVTPSACEIGAVKGGPPYVLFICSAAAGPNSALDWFTKQTCAKPGDVYGCSGTLWVYNPAGAGGKKAYCQGNWKNGNGNSTPSFPGSGIDFTEGGAAPVGEDWIPMCGA